MNMLSWAPKLTLLLVTLLFLWGRSQVAAWSPHVRITPSPSIQSDTATHYGKHFLLGFNEQHPSHQSSGIIRISIVASSNDTNVNITTATSNSPLYNDHIQAGQVMDYDLPVSLRMNGTGIEQKGIEVKSTKDIAVIGLNHASRTADAFLALPTHAIGRVYVVASYKPGEPSNFGVISGEDGTTISIQLKTTGTVVYRKISYGGGSVLNVTLQGLETFHVASLRDLSGTVIMANKPISVISGVACAILGPGACDHLAAFLLPVKNWGKEFLLASVGTMTPNAGDIFRVFAYGNNTIVHSAYWRRVLSSGEYTETDLGSDSASFVNCSKPCQVVQYVKGKSINGTSADPSIIVLPSVGQFLSYYRVVFPNDTVYSDSVTLMVEMSHSDGLIMDGKQMIDLQWQAINGTEYVWTVVRSFGSNAVTISHSSGATFGLLVFGWQSYVSYGYPGGFAFEKIRTGADITKCWSKVDLGFILDSSGSVPASEFQRMKTFVKNLTNFFTISPDETRVAVMSFSSSTHIHIHFSQQFSNRTSFHLAIDNIYYTAGGTATAMALNTAYHDMFAERNGTIGSERKKVLIILTDGYSNTGQVAGPARQLKNSGVVIFAVGIGPRLSTQELHSIASEPTARHVIRLDSFSQLLSLAERMSSQICNAAQFLIFCDNDFMTAVFLRKDLPKHVNVDQLYLRDGRCKATYNSSHVQIKTPLSGCGTVYEEDDQTMFFTNTISETSTLSGMSISAGDYLFKANLTCSYGRKRTVGSFSFERARQRLSVNLRGSGNLTFALDFYKSSSYREVYSVHDYPVIKRLSDSIHIQYSINTTNRDLVVHAETCRATPTNRAYDNPQYVFIADGCDNDNTILHYDYGMSSVQRFSIHVFRFITRHRFVYIHCDLVVCNRNYSNSICARGYSCSRRFRRDVSEKSSADDSSRMYSLSFGPVMYAQDETDNKSSGDAQSKAHYSVFGALIGIGCLALVLAGALVYVMKRGRRRGVSPTPITHVIPLEKVEGSA